MVLVTTHTVFKVASMAGLPRHVVERASDLLIFLERQAEGAKAGNGKTPNKRDVNQHSIFQFLAAQPMTTKENEIEKTIKELILIRFLQEMHKKHFTN